ncbi:hypothetical protein CDEN61S_03800 [Castellaniella denitrificans]
MHAQGNLKGSGKRVWQILLCLTLFALLFRAAVPAGYMPNLSGQDGGTLTVTLCTEHGGTALMPVSLHDDDAPQAPDHDGTGQFCPFCAVVSLAIMPGIATPTVAAAITHEITLPLPDDVKPLSALIAGPPLGSRAPPALLG